MEVIFHFLRLFRSQSGKWRRFRWGRPPRYHTIAEHPALGGVHARRARIDWHFLVVWCQALSLGDVAQVVGPNAFRGDALACRIPHAAAAGLTQLCSGVRCVCVVLLEATPAPLLLVMVLTRVDGAAV